MTKNPASCDYLGKKRAAGGSGYGSPLAMVDWTEKSGDNGSIRNVL